MNVMLSLGRHTECGYYYALFNGTRSVPTTINVIISHFLLIVKEIRWVCQYFVTKDRKRVCKVFAISG